MTKLQFVRTVAPAGSFVASGTIRDATGLSLSTKARLKVVSATVFGLSVVSSGSCQTSQPSTISLKSGGAFTPAAGGTLAASFSLSNLVGCGSLTGRVSPLVAGGGNSILLKLTPGPTVVFPG